MWSKSSDMSQQNFALQKGTVEGNKSNKKHILLDFIHYKCTKF